MAKNNQYYSLKRILEENATYNVIFGERSNGKTFAVQEYGLKEYCENGNQMAVIRRWADDYTGKRGQETFSALVNEDKVKFYTKGQFDRIVYSSSRWYLAKYDDELDKIIKDAQPFCYAFSLNTYEHDKSTAYPKVTNILFDEFLSRKGYLTDEFVVFMNTLSTIIRDRDNVKIFMCGNTVNQYCPYFAEMGLEHILKMKKGSIDLYTYGESKLTVAVEYSEMPLKKKKSDKYFAFNNPKLNMITGGAWEIALYPHLPYKYKESNIKLKYFIIFSKNILQCEIIKVNKTVFTYIHRKTSDIKFPDKDIVFSLEYSPKPNWFRRITENYNDKISKLYDFYLDERIFYQDNEVGEVIRNYIMWCKSDKGIV